MQQKNALIGQFCESDQSEAMCTEDNEDSHLDTFKKKKRKKEKNFDN